jgi:hypothetical protein
MFVRFIKNTGRTAISRSSVAVRQYPNRSRNLSWLTSGHFLSRLLYRVWLLESLELV